MLGLSLPLVAGTYSVRLRSGYSGSSGQVRFRFLTSGGSDVGVTSWQTVTGSFASYTLSVTLSGTATKIQVEVQ